MAGAGDGSDDVDVVGSRWTDVEVATGSEEPPAPPSEELDAEQPLPVSNAAKAAQTTGFNATQRQSIETSSRGSSKPLSVSRRGSESGKRVPPSRLSLLTRISPPRARAPMRAAMWTPWPA